MVLVGNVFGRALMVCMPMVLLLQGQQGCLGSIPVLVEVVNGRSRDGMQTKVCPLPMRNNRHRSLQTCRGGLLVAVLQHPSAEV